MNRRGVGFSIAVAFLVLFVLTAAFKIIYDKEEKQAEIRIGEREAALVDAYQEADRELFSVDLAARIAAQRAVYAMATGYESRCGSYLGYSLWNSVDGTCYPDANEYIVLFQEELAGLLLHPIPYDIKLAQVDDGFETIGQTSYVIEIPIG